MKLYWHEGSFGVCTETKRIAVRVSKGYDWVTVDCFCSAEGLDGAVFTKVEDAKNYCERVLTNYNFR